MTDKSNTAGQVPEALRPIARYKIGYATDSWGTRSSTPSGIPDHAGAWVRYEDHLAALVEAQQPATHVQNPAEIAHVAGDVSKNGAESNMAQRPAPSAAAALPEGWVPLVITHEGQYPEEVAYGPQILMDRLGKWLRKYFDHVVASKAQPTPTPQADSQPAPIDMVLHCPKCGLQHIDAPEKIDRRFAAIDPPAAWAMEPWKNEPHRSHLCHGCGHIWRPADVPTNGVKAVKATGKADSPIAARTPADSVTAPAGGETYHLGACIVDGVLSATVMRKEPGRAGAVTVLLSEQIPVEQLQDRDVIVDATPPAQAADSVLEDAARLDFLASAPEGCVRMDTSGGLCPSYIYWGTSDYYSNAGRNDSGNFIGPTPRAAIDAAMKARGAT